MISQTSFVENDYFVVYDNYDNIIAYCDNLEELSKLVNRNKKYLKFYLKDKDFTYIQKPSLLKVYKFSD